MPCRGIPWQPLILGAFPERFEAPSLDVDLPMVTSVPMYWRVFMEIEKALITRQCSAQAPGAVVADLLGMLAVVLGYKRLPAVHVQSPHPHVTTLQ